MNGPVVILGTGRCGTSLVGRLFEPLTDYRFEPRVPDLLTGRLQDGRRECWKLPWDPDDGRRTPHARVDVGWLRDVGAHVVWLVRHPLDFVCSAAPMWEERPADMASTTGNLWLADNADPHLAATVTWVGFNGRGLDAVVGSGVSLHLIRYEDVVDSPAWSARLLLGSAGFATDDGTADAWAAQVGNVKRRDDEDDRQADLWWRDDHDVRVGRWRDNLPAGAADAIWTLVEPLARRFGYTAERAERHAQPS